jgi:hypothetical protein
VHPRGFGQQISLANFRAQNFPRKKMQNNLEQICEVKNKFLQKYCIEKI